MRRFFEARDFLEVDTPLLLPAPAPETHIDPQPAGSGFLQTSPELCMKRLLAAGYGRIFQICKCFRRAERGRRHLPEFTLLEWYVADADYLEMMAQTEALIRAVAAEIGAGPNVAVGEGIVDLGGPWPRMTVDEAFARFGSATVEDALAAGRFDEIVGLEIEPNLGRPLPLFLYDYPAACAALARLKPPEGRLAERFELYVGGLELCNGFSELNDPVAQRRRFQAELDARRRVGRPVTPMPEKFLADLAAMPPAAGNALGVDRLAMLFAGAGEIDDVTAFVPEEL
jgi:lysyl-tRNA synthetase class 2